MDQLPKWSKNSSHCFYLWINQLIDQLIPHSLQMQNNRRKCLIHITQTFLANIWSFLKMVISKVFASAANGLASIQWNVMIWYTAAALDLAREQNRALAWYLLKVCFVLFVSKKYGLHILKYSSRKLCMVGTLLLRNMQYVLFSCRLEKSKNVFCDWCSVYDFLFWLG